jgi:hypothetical protein
MSCPLAASEAAKRHNLDGVRFCVVRGNSPTVANLEARRNHTFSLGWCAQRGKTVYILTGDA